MSEIQESSLKSFFRKHLGWVITGFLALLFWMQTCNLNQKIEQGKQQITQLQLDKQTLTQKVNEQGQVIQQQDAIIVDNTTALNNLTDTIFDLKAKDKKNLETIAYFKGISQISVVTVDVPYLDTTAMSAFEDSIRKSCPEWANFIRDSVIQVPAQVGLGTPHFELYGTVKKNSFTVDRLTIPDTLQLRFVEEKGGLFKRSKIQVQYFHSNPFVKDISANSVYYKPKRKSFFQRVILPVAVGVGAGILISR